MTQDLDNTALYALLDALGPTPAEAGAAYEGLRERLIRFFRWNHCSFPEELADTALDRLADKLSRNAEPILSPARFATGIARMLLLEQHAKRIRENKMLLWLSWFHEHRGPGDEEKQLYDDALSHCLDCLTSDSRLLLERYYSGDGSDRIRNRQALATELGIAMNALRNRALRLRDSLENCTARYLARDRRRDKSTGNATDRKSTLA
ncbi:MAG: hypothetical protein ABR956_14355 [Terracidiphilus sp.]|jgi:hypothetical protein